MDSKGNSVIAWLLQPEPCCSYYVPYAQRFNRDGNKIGSEFGLSGYDRRIAMDPNGDFITTSVGDEALYAQRYDRNGNTIGDSLLVSLSKAGGLDSEIGDSSVALNDNEFVVVWKDYDDSGMGVYARRFRTDGSEPGNEFQVNTYTEKQQVQPDVAMDKEGKSVIVWVTGTKYDPSADVFAQRFDKDGKRIGDEFRVNSYIDGWQGDPRIVMNYCNSDFVITWCDGGGHDGDGYGIYAKKFSFYNPADLDKDGYVNFKDYAVWANTFLKSGSNPGGDINQDGIVDYNDLEELTENWLAYYP